MPELPPSLIAILGALAGLQLITLLVLFRLSGRVTRLLRQGGGETTPGPTAGAAEFEEQKARNADQKHWFAEFLAEDESRKQLPKKEQFEAFRRWRKERGLNWQTPEGS